MKPQLRIVPKADHVKHNRRDYDNGCTLCALAALSIVSGIIWWPIFKLLGWL